MSEVTTKINYLGVSAVVIRADGTREDKGLLGEWYDLQWWIKKLKKRYGKHWHKHNPGDVVNNTGKAIVTNMLVNVATPPKYVSWGTGAGAAAAGNTSLSTESMSTSNDGVHNTRVTGTQTQQTSGGGTTYDTYQCVATLTADTGKTITNVGILDTIGTAADLVNPPTGGNLFVSSSFTGIPLSANDSIQFTLKTIFS